MLLITNVGKFPGLLRSEHLIKCQRSGVRLWQGFQTFGSVAGCQGVREQSKKFGNAMLKRTNFLAHVFRDSGKRPYLFYMLLMTILDGFLSGSLLHVRLSSRNKSHCQRKMKIR